MNDAEYKAKVYREVWDTLSKVNVNEHTQDKNGLTFLSWAWAWGVLMEHYPGAEFEFSDEKFYPDGSCQVECIVVIRGCERSMWLPVMDYRNNAVENPNARAISDTKMRCLVKCLAMWGLAHYIYAGEDLPEPEKDVPKKKASGKKKAPKKSESSASIEDVSPAILNGDEHPVVVATRGLIVAGANTIHELEKLWADNSASYKALDEAAYQQVVAVFSERKKQMKEEAN